MRKRNSNFGVILMLSVLLLWTISSWGTPLSGNYDIGGGNNNYISILAAVDSLKANGMSGPVTFNVYNGTYFGCAALNDSIAGIGGGNTLTFQAAPGQNPVLESLPLDYYCFNINLVDNIVIRGFSIDGYWYGVFVTGTYSDSCMNIVVENNTFPHNINYNANGGVYLCYSGGAIVRNNVCVGSSFGVAIDYSSDALVYNNMFEDQHSYGICVSFLSECGFYYNSVTCSTYCAYFDRCDTTVMVKNNIFNHTGTSGCALLTNIGAGGVFTSDYNDIYSRYNLIASIYGAACPYLYEWQTYSGQDAHSVSANPRFISGTNLHIDPAVLSWVSDTATPIAGISTDIDGDTRSALTPDIGCDEYTLIAPMPMSGVYDIGGGDFDFYTIKGAIDTLRMRGMGGPVTFDVYTGTYASTVYIDKWIPGLGSANPLVVQAAVGESPNIYWWEWNEIQAFDIYCADYVTIKGIAVDVLGTNIYVHGNPVDYCEHVTIENCYIPGGALPFVANGILVAYTNDFNILGNQIWNVPRGLTIQYAEDGIVANNRFSSNNYFSLYGLNASYCSNIEFLYNSFLMGGNYCAAIQPDDSTVALKNNIFYEITPTAYALQLYGPPVISDYNCFYSPINYNLVYTGQSYGFLEWQATGQDLHSVLGDPEYTADMHINPYVISPVSNAGTPIASVTNDIDNDIRSLATPDIGADEYFFIGQYGVILTPEDTTGTDTTGNTIYYPFYVKNTGTMDDSYTLSVIGTEWTAAVYNAPGGGTITAVSLLVGDSVCVYLGHSVPDGIPEQFQDDGLLIATSQANANAADTSTFMTHAIIWPPVQGEIELDTDIIIPAGGGAFTFQYTLTNYDQNNPYMIRVWKSVEFPNGQIANLWGVTFTIGAGDIRTRHVTQLVPGAALPGNYTYHMMIIHTPTWEIWDDDIITFYKEPGDGSNSIYTTWDWYGWDTPDMTVVIPSVYDMKPASPNPFNAETILQIDLPEAGKALLEIYDVTGRKAAVIANGYFSPGSYDFKFSAADLPSGVYFARLQAGKYVKTQKLVLLK